MNKFSARLSTFLVLTVLSLTAKAQYRIVELGTFGTVKSAATSVNDAGQVVGVACASTSIFFENCQMFRTDAGGRNASLMTPLPNFKTDRNTAVFINSTGKIFGNADVGSFMTGANGVGRTSVTGPIIGVNDQAQILTPTTLSGPNGTGPQPNVGPFPADAEYIRYSVLNNGANVVGTYYKRVTSGLAPRIAFITGPNGSGVQQLDSRLWESASFYGVNAAGQITGFKNGADIRDGFLTGANGAGVTFISSTFISPHDINASAQVLGDDVIYQNGATTRLLTLPAVVAAGWKQLIASKISNNGTVVGYGITKKDRASAFLLTQQAGALPSTSAVYASANPARFGSNVTITVRVGGAVPTGSVQLLDNGGNFGGPIPLVDGEASISTASLTQGKHTFTATYAGDASNLPSSAPPLEVVVATPASVSLNVTPSDGTPGTNVTFAVSVSGQITPTGTVQFKVNGSNYGSPVSLSNGNAALSTASLPIGSHSVVADYLGDANNLPNSSNVGNISIHAVISANGAQVPTLPEWALIFMAALMALVVRRRKTSI